MQIHGKVALVTGGAHRIGKAISMMLAAEGALVAVNYHQSGPAAQAVVSAVEANGGRSLAVQADVTDYEAVEGMMDRIESRFGGIDIVVNSAGLFQRTPFPISDLEIWRRVTAISIDGSFNVCNCAVPKMRKRSDGGAIIQIVDGSATQPWPNFIAHAVGKAGMIALTRQLAAELAPKIRVNAVAAGPVLAPDDLSEQGRARIAARTLLGRWGEAEDVATAVRYLLEAEFVTGEVLTVDGGEQLGYRFAGSI